MTFEEKDIKNLINSLNDPDWDVRNYIEDILVKIGDQAVEPLIAALGNKDMHLNIYKIRDDVKSIVHTHSPIATGFAFAGVEIKRLEGFGPIENPVIPFVEYAAPGTMKLAENVAKGLEKEDIVILKNHGVVACGENLDEAALLTEFIEESAKIQFVTRLIGTN